MSAHIAMKAAEHDDFRARLIAEPRATVEGEAGIRFLDSYQTHVHVDTATDAHVALLPKPALSQEQLDHIAGGHHGGPHW